MQVGRGHRAQGRQLRRRLLLVEYVERPVPDGASSQMGVMGSGAVVGTDDDRVEPSGLLLGPGQRPDRAGAAAGDAGERTSPGTGSGTVTVSIRS